MKRCPLCEENYTQCYHDKCPGGAPDWSFDLPAEPGWYWRRKRDHDGARGWKPWRKAEPVYVQGVGDYFVNAYSEWWPIRIPEPGKEGGE